MISAKRTVSLTCVAVALIMNASQAQADAAPAEVLVVLAKEAPGKIDPRLKDLPALRRAPFNAFRSMKILSRKMLRLVKGKDATVDLPNGRRVKLALVQKMSDGRFRVKVAINRPKKNDYLPLLQVVAAPGDPFFVAGQGHKGGTLVIGVRVGADAKKAK